MPKDALQQRNTELGNYDMSAHVLAYDWASTPLGPMQDWSPRRLALVDTVLSHGFPMIALLGPDLVQVYNDGYAQILGGKHPGGLGQPTQTCWPEVWHINGPIYARVMQGEVITREDGLYPLARSGQLKDAWFTLTYSPIRDDLGAVDGVLVTMIETTARILAERQRDETLAQLQEAEQRQRFLLELSDRLRLSDDPEGTATRMIAAHFGASAVRFVKDPQPMDGVLTVGGLQACRQGWTAPEIALLEQAAERALAAIEKARAEAALRDALDYQKLLLAELQHRVRNSLGIIGLIAERSGDSAPDAAGYRAAFLGRLGAFARVQAAVTRSPDQGLDLRGILLDELDAFPPKGLHLDGKPVLLKPRAAERLTLAFHELATNAAKYGALRDESGRLSVSWSVDADGLAINWCETGVPGVTTPTRLGFGSEIIQQALAYDLGASTRMDYEADGLCCHIRLPTRQLA